MDAKDEAGPCARCGAAGLDFITGVACISFWAGTWSLFDALAVHELASGVIAWCIVVGLSLASVDQWLARKCADLTPASIACVIAWLWTSFLAALSILIWRMGFHVVNTYFLPPQDSLRAILLTILGCGILALSGRLRSAGDAPPVGFVADESDAKNRFPAASYGRCSLVQVLLDVVLTVPVVLVWAGLWQLGDNLVVPLWPSFLVCNIVIALIGVLRVDALLRTAFSAPAVLVAIMDALWTLVLALLCIGSWRGTWELLDRSLRLASHPWHATLTLVTGVAILSGLRRYRSALFPPMDFTLDRDGPPFYQTGVHHHLAKAKPGENAEASLSAGRSAGLRSESGYGSAGALP